MGSAAHERLGLRRDPGGSGHQIAALLSALAEAPDFAAALSFLLAQLAEIAGARRAYALVPDDDGDFQPASQLGFGLDEARVSSLSAGDVDHPLVVSATAILPKRGASRTLDIRCRSCRSHCPSTAALSRRAQAAFRSTRA